MLKTRFLTLVFLGAIAFNAIFALPLRAQLPFLPQIDWETFKLNQNPELVVESACVRLDGRCIFTILDRRSNLNQRLKYTEARLKDISQVFFRNDDNALKVYYRGQGDQENIYVAVGESEIPVMTLYSRDATTRGVNLEHQAREIVENIEIGLKRAKRERQTSFLLEQAKIAAAIATVTLLAGFAVFNGQKKSQKAQLRLEIEQIPLLPSIPAYFGNKQRLNLRKLQYRLLQCLQIGIWLGGSLLILGLFPYTRSLQLWIITLLRIPLRIGLVGLVTYILIRLSYAIVAKFNRTFSENYVLSRDRKRRLQLRITTVSRLLGGIVTFLWIVLGTIIALTLIGFNVTPLLAGAGILGLAFSFASQNLIKDAINGFFIILEDQYAVGDVINLGTVSGLVENLNLRITQLRDGQGRLITIPNSEIKTVANLSSQWSRAEIDIPISYQTKIDTALELIKRVANHMSLDPDWQEQILEPPLVLGVDHFSDRGSVVRLWIKTEPLKQWDVAREFHRRIQNAFEQAEIPLPLSQQQVWLNREQ